MNHVTNLIIGAGPTGLILAEQLEDQYNTLVLSVNIGGLLQTIKVGDYKFDCGGHVYTTKDRRTVKLLTEADAVIHTERYAFWGSKELGNIPFPVQNHLDIKPQEPPLKVYSLAEYALNQFGEEFYEKFFRPFNTRVWTVEPTLMDWNWVNTRVASKDEITKRQWGINAEFLYAPGEEIINVLVSRIPNVTIQSPVKVTKIDYGKKIAYFTDLELGFSGYVGYDNIFMTHAILGPSNIVHLFCVGLKKEIDDHFHWMYPDFSSPVHRITLISKYKNGMAPEFTDSLLLEVPYNASLLPPGEITEDKPNDEIVANLLKNCGFSISKDDIAVVKRLEFPGYPIPILGVRGIVASVKRGLLPHDAYTLGRWGSHGYFNLQHLFQDVDATIHQLGSKTPIEEYLYSSFYFRREEYGKSSDS